MADKTINDLTAATTLNDGDLFELENTGNNSRKMTASNARLYMNGFTLAGSWTWSTNVTQVDFTGLGSYNEVLFIARGVTTASSGVRQLQVSVDGGSTFYSASGDYKHLDNVGVENNGTAFNHSTSSTAARTLVVQIKNMKGAVKLAVCHSSTGIQSLFTASASDINALRFSNSAGGNLTAGSAIVLAR